MQNASKTPIVDLLRRIPRETWVEIVEPSGWSYHTNIGNLLHQAADEIDRLQNNAQQGVQRTRLAAIRSSRLCQKGISSPQLIALIVNVQLKKTG